jgi:hypothetical protein
MFRSRAEVSPLRFGCSETNRVSDALHDASTNRRTSIRPTGYGLSTDPLQVLLSRIRVTEGIISALAM